MNFYNAAFGDLIFGSGVFGNIGQIRQTGIVWTNICPIISAWDDASINEAAWINQAAEIDSWKKIRSDIKNSTPCRRT